MSRTMLLVGTRKGCFLLERDDHGSWSHRGPYCESWPIYHAVQDADSAQVPQSRISVVVPDRDSTTSRS